MTCHNCSLLYDCSEHECKAGLSFDPVELRITGVWALTWMNRNAERNVLAALWAEIVFRKGDQSWFATWSRIVWLDWSLRDQLAPIAEMTTMKRSKILKPNFVIVIMQNFRCVCKDLRFKMSGRCRSWILNFTRINTLVKHGLASHYFSNRDGCLDFKI